MSDDGSQRDGSYGEFSQPSSSSSGDNAYHAPFFQIPQPPNLLPNQINGFNNHNHDGANENSQEDSGHGSGYSNATTAVIGDLENDSPMLPTSQDETSPKVSATSGDSNDTKRSSLSSQLSASFGSPGSQCTRSKDEFVLSQPDALPDVCRGPATSSPIHSPQRVEFSQPLVVLDANVAVDTLTGKKYNDYYNISTYKDAFDGPQGGGDEGLKSESVGDVRMVVSESSLEESLELKSSPTEEVVVVFESDNDESMTVCNEGVDECGARENGRLSRIVMGDGGAFGEAKLEMFGPNNDPFAPLRQPILDFQRAMQDLPGPSGVPKPRAKSATDDIIIVATEVPKWKTTKPSMKSTYISLKGKGRGKRSKPIDPEETTGPKIRRYSRDEPPAEPLDAKNALFSSDESTDEPESKISHQVLESLCVQVEKRVNSDIPMSCEPLVNKYDLPSTSSEDKCVKRDRQFAKRHSNYFPDVDLQHGGDSLRSLSKPAKSTVRKRNVGELVNKVTTTTYTKVVVLDEILDGDLVLDFAVTEREWEPDVVVTEEALDYERTVNHMLNCDDDDDDDDDDYDDDYDEPEEKNLKPDDVVMQSCENKTKNVIEDHDVVMQSCENKTKNVTEAQCLTLSDIPANFNDICIGKRVMARWKDGFLYPGTVKEKDDADRWVVKYDDGSVRPAKTTIFAIDILPVKIDIFAQLNREPEFKVGTILSQEIGGDEVKYLIELKSGDRRIIPHSAIALSIEQSEIFKVVDNFIEPGITLDNIIAGKRRHKPTNYSIQSPEKEETLKNKGSDRKIVHSSKRPSCKKSNTMDNLVRLCDRPKARRNILFRPNKTLHVSKSDQVYLIPISKRNILVPEHGPIPPEGSELFKGKTFLITQAPSTTSNEMPPLNKVHLKSQITAGGGVVLADLIEDEIKMNISEYFLISDTHCRTGKYMIALSVSIPCVSHLWIIYCCKQAKLLNCEDFMLPAGYSCITDEIIEWHGRSRIFGGLSFAFAFDANSDCVQLLSQVLNLSGGRVVTDKNSFDLMDINVILVDDGLAAPDREHLLLFKKPIVTKEWVFHCLIHGCKLKYAAHAKFSIRF